MSDVGTSGGLCLICVAKRREKERQKNLHRNDLKDLHVNCVQFPSLLYDAKVFVLDYMNILYKECFVFRQKKNLKF